MSCKYCSVYPRNPCRSSAEASHCPNAPDPGMYLELDAKEVAAWIRYQASGDQELMAAADLIERKL